METEFMFEYVTGPVSLRIIDKQGDSIIVTVVNESDTVENIRVVIYYEDSIAEDSGSIEMRWSKFWTFGFNVTVSGYHWVQVQASSEFLIPQVLFERVYNQDVGFTPLVSYRPGDFAVFELTPSRKRIW